VFLGFGSNGSTGIALGPSIDITSNTTISNFAFSVSHDGTITSVAAFFSVVLVSFPIAGTTITIRAQLYRSVTPNNIFLPVPGTLVTLSPTLTGLSTLGNVTNGIIQGLAIPVTAQTRLLMVFSATAQGTQLNNQILAHYGAGVTIV